MRHGITEDLIYRDGGEYCLSHQIARTGVDEWPNFSITLKHLLMRIISETEIFINEDNHADIHHYSYYFIDFADRSY